MSDPFLIEGPACVNVSGGRTSAYMLRRVMDAHGGRLPAAVHAVFCNTGRERPETLRFVADVQENWGVNVRWIERRGDADDGFAEVEYETASRNGEPFAELIREKRYLPNPVTRFCTQDLKIRVTGAFMRSEGHDHWTDVVGLRRDEPQRVAKLRGRDHGDHDIAVPLYDARVTKRDVLAFWRSQPFNLALKPWESNCDLCFMKGRAQRERIMRDRPDLAAWWVEQERAVGARFLPHEPAYAKTLENVRRLPLLPVDLDGESAMGCTSGTCTDRRAPAPGPACTCRRKAGQPHALACARGPLFNPSPRRRAA